MKIFISIFSFTIAAILIFLPISFHNEVLSPFLIGGILISIPLVLSGIFAFKSLSITKIFHLIAIFIGIIVASVYFKQMILFGYFMMWAALCLSMLIIELRIKER